MNAQNDDSTNNMSEETAAPNLVCVICEDETTENEGHKVAGYDMCDECFTNGIKSQFNKALEHEFAFPPRFGNVELEASDFVSALGDDFVQRFDRRALEYRTPVEERIICQHLLKSEGAPPKGALASEGVCFALSSNALASLQNVGSEMVSCGAMVSNEPRQYRMIACYRCGGWTCGRCDKALDYFGQSHEGCEKPKIRPPALDGQVKGEDYQLCPECDISIYLTEACNHMICEQCNTHFCYVCGERARPGIGHWSNTSCPQYGKRKRSNIAVNAPVDVPLRADLVEVRQSFGGGHGSLDRARIDGYRFMPDGRRGTQISPLANLAVNNGVYSRQMAEELILAWPEATTDHVEFGLRVVELREFVANRQNLKAQRQEVLSGVRRTRIQDFAVTLESVISALDRPAQGQPWETRRNSLMRHIGTLGRVRFAEELPLNYARWLWYISQRRAA